jgi:hypothetical protein
MRTLPIFYLLMGVVEELATTLEHHGLWMIMCIDLLWHWYVPYVPHWILNCFYMCAGLRYFKQSAAEKWEDQLWLLESQNKDFVVLHPGRNSWTVVIISIFTTCESCAWVSKESGIDKTVVLPLLLFVASLKLTLGLHLHKRGGASSMVMPIFYGNSV